MRALCLHQSHEHDGLVQGVTFGPIGAQNLQIGALMDATQVHNDARNMSLGA